MLPPGRGTGFHPASFQSDAFQSDALQNHAAIIAQRGSIIHAAANLGINNAVVTDTPFPLRMEALRREAIEAKISQDHQASVLLAANVARQIQVALDRLNAQKPNEIDALAGYANFSDVLIGRKIGFETVAFEIEQGDSEIAQEVRDSRFRRAAEAALKVCDEIVSYFEKNPEKVALVIAQMGLAGTISGALSYFGVPALISFPVAIAGLNDANLWEAIKFLLPKDKSK